MNKNIDIIVSSIFLEIVDVLLFGLGGFIVVFFGVKISDIGLVVDVVL